jgi:hypothetical protein
MSASCSTERFARRWPFANASALWMRSEPIGACFRRGRHREADVGNPTGFEELANLHHLRLQQTVAREVKHRHAPVQCDADPALERMGEDRVENFALMVVHGQASPRLIRF